MGFFTGFAPTGKDSIFSSNYNIHLSINPSNKSDYYYFSPQPVEMLHQKASVVNRSLIAEAPLKAEEKEDHSQRQANKLKQKKLIIIVTPTSTKENKFEGVVLRRLANTIRLVPPPLLWIVVERQSESNQVSEVLRKTGIMYRHLVFKENFTDLAAEMDHQRNVALKHIQHHKLSGIVHFAGLSNIYDLQFFDELRRIEYEIDIPFYIFSSLLSAAYWLN